MRRHVLGLLAMVFLFLAGALLLWGGEQTAGYEGMAWRVGTLMAVWWLAYPDIRRLPAWLLIAVPLLVVILAVRPRLALVLVPIVLLIALVRPRRRQ